MKKALLMLSLVALLSISLAGCLGTKDTAKDTAPGEEVADTNTEAGKIPFDYPVVATTAKAGEYVLTPSKESLDEATKGDAANTVMTFYTAKMVTPGASESEVEYLTGEKATMPNSLIVALPLGQEAAVGDTVLTWWQDGSGMTKALVTEAGKAPKAVYLDDFLSGETITLLENSFVKLSGSLEPGVTVAAKQESGSYDRAVVVNVSGEKVLTIGFADMMAVYNKSDLISLPLKIEAAAGDKIMAPVIGTYQEVTVKEVKAEEGLVVCEYKWVDEMQEETFAFGDIAKTL